MVYSPRFCIKRKIVVSGEAAGLQIQLGPPAVPGRFDSCDLPPIPAKEPSLVAVVFLFTGRDYARKKDLKKMLFEVDMINDKTDLYFD